MKKIYRLIFGSTKYRACTHFPARLCGELMSLFPETVFDVRVCDSHSIEFSCYSFSKKKIIESEILRDSEISFVSENGLPFLLKKHRNRFGLLIGAFIFVLALYLQSLIVWDIRISGNNSISDNEIKQVLMTLGFSEGKSVKPSELLEIQNRFLLAEERISWISINMSGTVAFVEVKERKVKVEMTENPSMSGILSVADCVVELCEVTSGTALVKAGDTVRKGQMVISPIELGKDGKEYLSGAYGEIIARTYEEFCVCIDYYSQRPGFTGRESTVYDISLLGRTIEIRPPDFIVYDSYVCIKSKSKLKIFDSIELPVEVTKKRKLEYTVCEEIITPEQARQRAYNQIYQKISQELSDAEILSTVFYEEEETDAYILRCKVECLRNVAGNI